MIKLTYSKSILSSTATTFLLLLSMSILSHSQFQLSSSDTSFASFLFSPSSSTVMLLAQPSNQSNTTMGNTLIGNSNNESAGAINTTGMQSNETGNRTIARWISLGPIQQVTQSNGTANNSNTDTTTSTTTTNTSGKAVQRTERTTDPAVLQQTSNVPITKQEAIKAEQEASIMIKAYYEKVEQEKREQAAALAAAQANQTTDTIEGSEGGATAASDETETEAEKEQEDQDDEEGNEEGDENENGNDEEG